MAAVTAAGTTAVGMAGVSAPETRGARAAAAAEPTLPTESPLVLGGRTLETRYFLAPLAGYTQLAFRRAMRPLGGLGLATTDLVQAGMLLGGRPKSLKLIETTPDDRPLTVQIFGGVLREVVEAARKLEGLGYEAVDLNMGCPMAKVTGGGGGARLMCDREGTCELVSRVVEAVSIPVSVKMRLGWDRENRTAPALTRAFEGIGVCAVTVHGRTRQQGFTGVVDLDGVAETAAAAESIPVVGNGDVRTPADALRMRRVTGCDAVAIGRGAMLDPWVFRKIADVEAGRPPREPSPAERVAFLRRHFELMHGQHGDYGCVLIRKFAAWYGATLGIPEDLEDRLRRLETAGQFEAVAAEAEGRLGERRTDVATALVRTPNGPVEHW